MKRWERFLWAVGYIQGDNPPPRWPPWERFLKLIGYIHEYGPVEARR